MLASKFLAIKHMHRILIITAFIIISLDLSGQQKKRFEYTRIGYSSYLVSPVFDQTKLEGNMGMAIFLDQSYMDDLFNNAINLTISKGKRDSVSLNTVVRFAINQKGVVFYCQFFLNFKDTLLIKDEDLFNLYHLLKKIKIDMTKVRIDPYYPSDLKYADYAIISGSLISKESRYKLNKEFEERLRKKRLQNQYQPDSIINH
jgi:hypothetical protein